MIESLGALQQLVLGLLLLWAGLLKVASRGSAEAANASALPLLLRREALAVPVYRIVGGVEAAVAVLLLLPPAPAWEMAGAVVLTGLFAGYLAYSRRAAPGASCGCLGARHAPVSWRTLLRAGLLCAAALLGLAGGGHWAGAAADRPAVAAAALTLEGLALVALSPELRPGRRLRVRTVRPGRRRDGERSDCGSADVPIDATLNQLERSAPYQRLADLLAAGLPEHWQDGCWRFLSYPARYEGAPATAVFAVPLIHGPDWIRAAVTDAAGENVLLTVEPQEPVRALT